MCVCVGVYRGVRLCVRTYTCIRKHVCASCSTSCINTLTNSKSFFNKITLAAIVKDKDYTNYQHRMHVVFNTQKLKI